MKPTTSLDKAKKGRPTNEEQREKDLQHEMNHPTGQPTHIVKVWKQATLKNKHYEGEGMALVTQISFEDIEEAMKYYHSVRKHLQDYDELYKIKNQPGPGWVQHRVTLCSE